MYGRNMRKYLVEAGIICGNRQIFCGNVHSTERIVTLTLMKNSSGRAIHRSFGALVPRVTPSPRNKWFTRCLTVLEQAL
jgi:hypothetical protein